MRYLSVCSGIEAASVAWHHLGWEPVGFSEIEPFPSAVLAHRFPAVPNYGDMTKFQEWPIEPGTIDILVGGTPCQSFSVAGLRQGLADPRGNLMLTYLAIAARFRPRWVVWENVPGVLSSSGGRDFGTFLRALGELGYGWAYRVLDAQYVRVGKWPRAVPQRRRRVFVVGRLIERGVGDWSAAAEVLALREGLQRHIEASGKTRKGAASDAEVCAGSGCYWNGEQVAAALTRKGCDDRMPDKERLFAVLQPTAGTLGNRGLRSHTELDGHGPYIPVAEPVPIQDGREIEKRQNGLGIGQPGDPAYTVDTTAAQAVVQPVPYDLFQITAPVNRKNRKPGDPCHTLARDNAAHAAIAIGTDCYNGAITGEVAATMGTPGSSVNASGPTVMQAVACVNMQGSKSNACVSQDGSAYSLNAMHGHDVHAVAHTLRADGFDAGEDGTGRGTPMIPQGMTVRRLTPRECERLQGFPDDWTLIPWRGKAADQCPDGPRYKALGNSMACNCMAWIGERIAAVHSRHDQRAAP